VRLLSTRFRYDALAQVFHWLTAVLVVAAYFMGPGGSEDRGYSSANDFSLQIHETLGISVLAIVLLRVLWRLKRRNFRTPWVYAQCEAAPAHTTPTPRTSTPGSKTSAT